MLRRDRWIVLASLAAITILAWLYLAWLNAVPSLMPMPEAPAAMEMSGMDMGAMAVAPASPPPTWSTTGVALLFAMWAVMMIGMMTPSIAPMILLYARVARSAEAQRKPFASSVWFMAGYVLAWTLFAVLATAGHLALDAARMLTPMMAAASPPVGAALLILAGVYQWTPLKDVCLAQCQSPLQFIQRHGGFRGDPGGAIRLGLRHGLYCIGCCWPLMLLLFLGGVMNLLWIAALAAVVLSEKVLPFGRLFARIAGAMMIAAALALLF